jgi:hypothetical protein
MRVVDQENDAQRRGQRALPLERSRRIEVPDGTTCIVLADPRKTGLFERSFKYSMPRGGNSSRFST